MSAKQFHKLKIGEQFTLGKSKGAGALSDKIHWEELEKLTKGTAVVRRAVGYHTEGHIRSFHANSITFDIS